MNEEVFNKSILVIVSSLDIDIYDSLNRLFDNVIVALDKYSNANFVKSINESKIDKIYLAGNHSLYRYLLPRIKDEIDICWIYSNSFSDLSDVFARSDLMMFFDYYNRGFIKKIGCVKKEVQTVFENAGYKCELLNLIQSKKVLKQNKINSNSIGIISNDHDPRNNFYNQMAALTLVDYDICKCVITKKETKKFAKFFDIRIDNKKSIDDAMKDNFVNLYVNFTNTNDDLIVKSFEYGVPVLVGNTTFFEKNKYLQEHLVVKTGDSIDEISNKILFVKKNYKKILEEYSNL